MLDNPPLRVSIILLIASTNVEIAGAHTPRANPKAATPTEAIKRPAPKATAPAAATKAPAPKTSNPAPATKAPAPKTSNPAPATRAPAPRTSIAPPNAIKAIDDVKPYSEITGNCTANRAKPTETAYTPTPINAIAAPKAKIPTAPAVKAGPKNANTAASAAIPIAIPTIVKIAPAPAFDNWMAA
ncbi:Uncharacterised protein [Streptococcus pneumoniae]|nr:Uncharacterised protein [Streptococcus pneumoniae]